MNYLKKLAINGDLKSILEWLSLFSIIFYIAGFLVWNIFLLNLKFNEIELLQSRFIYSGIFFVIYSGFFAILFSLLLKATSKIKEFRVREWRFGKLGITLKIIICIIISILFTFWLFFYALFILPRVPKIFGGGLPTAVSIIPNESTLNLKDFESLSIPRAAGENVIQTASVCAGYENSDSMLILLKDRVVILNKSNFKGFVVLPGDADINDLQNDCGKLATGWVINNNYSWLSKIPFFNLFVEIQGFSKNGV